MALGAAAVTLVKAGGGVFEITIDDELVFSKKKLGRFPTDEEIDALAHRARRA
jgi:selT/selW/selH-like putative selenoprotein